MAFFNKGKKKPEAKKSESSDSSQTSSTLTSAPEKKTQEKASLLRPFENNENYLLTHSIESSTSWILDAETKTPLMGVAIDQSTTPFTVTLTINQAADTADFDELIERLQRVYRVLINRKYLYLQEAEPGPDSLSVRAGLTSTPISDSVYIPEELLPKTIH